MDAYTLAKNNYGRTWTIEMIRALVAKKQLTSEQFEDITGEKY